jgi:hypothetical protein
MSFRRSVVLVVRHLLRLSGITPAANATDGMRGPTRRALFASGTSGELSGTVATVPAAEDKSTENQHSGDADESMRPLGQAMDASTLAGNRFRRSRAVTIWDHSRGERYGRYEGTDTASPRRGTVGGPLR